jgi:hypothetical protein
MRTPFQAAPLLRPLSPYPKVGQGRRLREWKSGCVRECMQTSERERAHARERRGHTQENTRKKMHAWICRSWRLHVNAPLHRPRGLGLFILLCSFALMASFASLLLANSSSSNRSVSGILSKLFRTASTSSILHNNQHVQNVSIPGHVKSEEHHGEGRNRAAAH